MKRKKVTRTLSQQIALQGAEARQNGYGRDRNPFGKNSRTPKYAKAWDDGWFVMDQKLAEDRLAANYVADRDAETEAKEKAK